MFDYDELSLERTCFECEENKKTMKEIVYWFEVILDLVYSTRALDEREFENCLDEIAYNLDVKLPEGKMNLGVKPPYNKNKDHFLNTFDQINNILINAENFAQKTT